jgi:hypothetical protein
MLALLACSALAVRDGYQSFKVTAAKPFCAFLAIKTFALALGETPPASGTFTIIGNDNKTCPVPMSVPTHLPLFETAILAPAETALILYYQFATIFRSRREGQCSRP